jgi:hypothetical protein
MPPWRPSCFVSFAPFVPSWSKPLPHTQNFDAHPFALMPEHRLAGWNGFFGQSWANPFHPAHPLFLSYPRALSVLYPRVLGTTPVANRRQNHRTNAQTHNSRLCQVFRRASQRKPWIVGDSMINAGETSWPGALEIGEAIYSAPPVLRRCGPCFLLTTCRAVGRRTVHLDAILPMLPQGAVA